MINVTGCICEPERDYKKRSHVFRIITPNHAEFLFEGATAAVMHEWVTSIVLAAGPVTAVRQAEDKPDDAADGEKADKKKAEKEKSATLKADKSGSLKADKSEKPEKTDKGTVKGDKEKRSLFKKGATSAATSGAKPEAKAKVTFGVPLADQVMDDELVVPMLLAKCIAKIDETGLLSVGVYRLAGNAISNNALKGAFDSDPDAVNLNDIDSYGNDINVVADCVKSFLRELPVPVVPFEYYAQFIAASRQSSYDDRMYEIQRLVHALPTVNFNILRYLAGHLARVAHHSEENKMAVPNLAIVFGPNLLRPETESMVSLMQEMPYKCAFVETLIMQPVWIFDEYEAGEVAGEGGHVAEGGEEDHVGEVAEEVNFDDVAVEEVHKEEEQQEEEQQEEEADTTEQEPITSEETAAEPITTEETAAEPIATEETAAEPITTEEPAAEPITTEETAAEPIAAEEAS